MASRFRRTCTRWLGIALVGGAVTYPLLLLGIWAMLRFTSESWWMTGILLFLPRLPFALPLPFLAIGLALTRRRRLLALQLVSALILLFPLLGFTVNWPRTSSTEPRVRVLSYNVNSARGGLSGGVGPQIRASSPDVVFLQELHDFFNMPLSGELKPLYPHQHAHEDLVVASRFPIVDVSLPPPVKNGDEEWAPRFVRVVIDTPLGKVTFFNVHTISPRSGFYKVRGQGLRREILSGRFFAGTNAAALNRITRVRTAQIDAVAAAAAAEQGLFVIVGDTNLPTLSPTRERMLGHLRDGFSEAGQGFGYTFPTKWPWMRIDVMLASAGLQFERFVVGDSDASDHLHVVADLVRERL